MLMSTFASLKFAATHSHNPNPTPAPQTFIFVINWIFVQLLSSDKSMHPSLLPISPFPGFTLPSHAKKVQMLIPAVFQATSVTKEHANGSVSLRKPSVWWWFSYLQFRIFFLIFFFCQTARNSHCRSL